MKHVYTKRETYNIVFQGHTVFVYMRMLYRESKYIINTRTKAHFPTKKSFLQDSILKMMLVMAIYKLFMGVIEYVKLIDWFK